MLTRQTIMFATLLLAANAACASDETSFFGKGSGGWTSSKEDMALINSYQMERSKQDAQEVAAAVAKLKSRQALLEGESEAVSTTAITAAPSQERVAPGPQKTESETLAYESSSGDIMKYPIPCNEDNGLYIVDFRRSPPCDLTYPAGNMSGLDIQTPQPLTSMEVAQRAQRPHMTF